MLLKDVMKDVGTVCTESMPLQQVYEMMQQSGSGFATVVENRAHQKPLGIITEHDICLQVVGRNRDPKGMAAANVMNTKFTKVNCDSTVTECARLAEECGAEKILIVDENGILCGTVEKTDLVLLEPVNSNRIGYSRQHYADYQVSRVDRIF